MATLASRDPAGCDESRDGFSLLNARAARRLSRQFVLLEPGPNPCRGAAARSLLLGVLSLLLTTFAATVHADEHDDEYDDAIESFRGAEETAPFFESAYAYVVFPTIGKGGIGLGGAHGSGRVYAQGQYVGDTTMTQLTVGFQLGVQAYSQMIFLEDRRALDSFTSGNFEFSAQATAVAITAGVSAEANTGGGTAAGASGGRNDATVAHGGYRKGMAVFTIARGGLMAEASLGGQKFSYQPL